MIKNNLSDKELLGYILGSFEYVSQYLNTYNEDQFEKDLIIQDAVCYRMYQIGFATENLSSELKKRNPDFPWYLYTIWKTDQNLEVIWDLIKGSQKVNGDFDSILDLFTQLEKIYFKEYFPKKKNTKKDKEKEIPWSTDYKYPIKTSCSIWTVKKR